VNDAGKFQDAGGKGGFPVVDMRNNTEVSYIFHVKLPVHSITFGLLPSNSTRTELIIATAVTDRALTSAHVNNRIGAAKK
jgi:hypothetical protein